MTRTRRFATVRWVHAKRARKLRKRGEKVVFATTSNVLGRKGPHNLYVWTKETT